MYARDKYAGLVSLDLLVEIRRSCTKITRFLVIEYKTLTIKTFAQYGSVPRANIRAIIIVIRDWMVNFSFYLERMNLCI